MKKTDEMTTPFLLSLRLSETIAMKAGSATDSAAVMAQRMVDGYRELAKEAGLTLGMGFVREIALRSIQTGVELLRIAELEDGLRISCLYCGGTDTAISTRGETVTKPMMLLHERCAQREFKQS